MKIEALPLGRAKEPGRLLHEVTAMLRAAGRLPHGRDVHEAVARSVSRLAAGEDFPTTRHVPDSCLTNCFGAIFPTPARQAGQR